MKRGIGYILLLLGTLYMAILYGSKGILLLFYLEIIMAITLFLFLLWVRGRIQVRLQLSVTTVERGDVVLMQIQLARESIIPMNRVGVQLEIATSGQKKKERCEFWGVITDQSEGTGMLELHYQTRMIGDVQIQIRRIWCSDFFGIMRVSVPRKKWDPQSQKDLLVLPPVCEVPVYISRKIRDYMGESDLYSTYQGGDDPSETFQIRDYQPGDRVRDIHWKLSAKEEDVMVREHGLPLGCPVVLWLDFYTAKKHKSPKRDRLIQIAASLSMSLSRQMCRHYVTWYDPQYGDVIRQRIEKEEDVYEMLSELGQSQSYHTWVDGRELYREKYHEPRVPVVLSVGMDAVLSRNDIAVAEYDGKDLAQQMGAVEIHI